MTKLIKTTQRKKTDASRLRFIRKHIRRGDKALIHKLTGISLKWIGKILAGKAGNGDSPACVSVMHAAELVLADRDKLREILLSKIIPTHPPSIENPPSDFIN